ncbi:PilW family protein, partial [Kaarinaea lacus]
MKRQCGITVVEILVGLALSLIILAGVMHIFINNKQTFRVQEAFARLQENGRFATQFITKDLRMAGYVGCGGKISNPVNMADLYPPPNGDNVADSVGNFNASGIEGFQTSDLPLALT